MKFAQIEQYWDTLLRLGSSQKAHYVFLQVLICRPPGSMMTTTAAHNSARQYMHHDNEDRMQVWHREQLQLPIPNPRLQLTVNIPAHNHRKKYQNMKVTLTAYPSPALWLPTPHMTWWKSSSGLVSLWCVCRLGLCCVWWRMFWCSAWQRLSAVNSIKMHIIQPESQSGQIPADFPRCGSDQAAVSWWHRAPASLIVLLPSLLGYSSLLLNWPILSPLPYS